MIWLALAFLVGAVLVLVAALTARRRRVEPIAMADVDPLFVTGIAVAGTGAALTPTLAPASYVMLVAGLVVLFVGAWRMRSHG